MLLKCACCLGALMLAARARAEGVAIEKMVSTSSWARGPAGGAEAAACSLAARARMDGEDKAIQVRFEDARGSRPCAAALPGALWITVRAIEQGEGTRIVVEARVSDGAASPTVSELEEIVRATAGEMKRRLDANEATTLVPRMRSFSPALTGTGIAVGVAGFVSLSIGYVWLIAILTQPNLTPPCGWFGCTAHYDDPTVPGLLTGAGLGSMLIGAGLAVIGERRVAPQSARVVPLLSPQSVGVAISF